MRQTSNNKNSHGTLRKRAEALLRLTRADIKRMTPEDMQRAVHELQIHQIELRLQNETLRETQVELLESRDRFSDLYEFAPVGYVTMDKNGKILECNLTAATMLGVERRSLLRANISKFVTRESQDDWYLYRVNAFATGTKQTCEIGMRRAEGTPLTVHLDGIMFGPPNDRRCRAALIDITGRRLAEEALRDVYKTLERRVQQQTSQIALQAKAIANLDEGVLISEGADWPESRIVFVNEAACRMTGYAAAELIGQPRRILRGSWMDHETLSGIRSQLSAGNSYKAECLTFRKEGSHYDTDLSITPLRNNSGQCTNFVSIHRDISERKQAERRLHQYREDLRSMASELLLAEEQQRKQLAQDLHDSLGQAMFRLRMKVDQLAKGQPAAKEIAAILVEMGKVVNTLTFELSPRVLHELGLRPAIRWLATSIKEQFGLSVHVDDDGQPIRLDERAALVLFRSARELLVNIAKHAQTNSAQISMRSVDSNLQLEIRDKGKGFNPATQIRHVGDGHFGLFSIRERLEYLGGTMLTQSEPGAGTAVTLTLPLAAAAAKTGTS